MILRSGNRMQNAGRSILACARSGPKAEEIRSEHQQQGGATQALRRISICPIQARQSSTNDSSKQHQPPERAEGDVMGAQVPAHEIRRVGEGGQAHHRSRLGPLRRQEESRPGPNRMSEQEELPCADARLAGEPVEAAAEVFRKPRQRREIVGVAPAVVARVQEERGVAGRVEQLRERQHVLRVAAPAVHHRHRRRLR
jgi:hypothetical protein